MIRLQTMIKIDTSYGYVCMYDVCSYIYSDLELKVFLTFSSHLKTILK